MRSGADKSADKIVNEILKAIGSLVAPVAFLQWRCSLIWLARLPAFTT